MPKSSFPNEQDELETSSLQNFDEVLAATLDTALKLTNAKQGRLAFLDQDKQTIEATKHADNRAIDIRIKSGGKWFGESDQLQYLGSEKLKSILIAPVIRNNEVIGVVSVESPTDNAFSESDERALKLIADNLALTLQNIRLSKIHHASNDPSEIVLQTHNEASTYPLLTPAYLASDIVPYLKAITDIQHVIDEILGRTPSLLKIRSITQKSPISVSLEGAAEAVQEVKDTVIPWRREHIVIMARLAEQEKQAEIETKKAEVLEKRASATKSRAEAEKLLAEAARQHEEAERLKLENEKLRLELHRAKIQLALDILNKLAPALPETERITYLVKLLPSLDTLTSSNLEIVVDATKDGP